MPFCFISGVIFVVHGVLPFECSPGWLNWFLCLFSERCFQWLIVWVLFSKIPSPKRYKCSLRKPWVALNGLTEGWDVMCAVWLLCFPSRVSFPASPSLEGLLRGCWGLQRRGAVAGESEVACDSAFALVQVGFSLQILAVLSSWWSLLRSRAYKRISMFLNFLRSLRTKHKLLTRKCFPYLKCIYMYVCIFVCLFACLYFCLSVQTILFLQIGNWSDYPLRWCIVTQVTSPVSLLIETSRQMFWQMYS